MRETNFRLPTADCRLRFRARGARHFLQSKIGNRKSAILALLLAGLAGCQSQKNASLVVYSAGPEELASWLCGEFEKQSGIPTKLFSATTGELMAKLEAEKFRPQADVVILASPTAAEVLKSEGRLAPLPKSLPTRAEWTDAAGVYAGTAASALGIAVRRDAGLPSLEWSDVFAGRIPGAMMMPSPSQSGTSAEFVIAFDLARGEPFWQALKQAKQNGLQISGPNSQALTGLVLRSHEAVLAAADYLVFRQIEKGEPLVMKFPASGVPVIPRPIAILKDARNPEAARRFVEFCFSRPAQERIAATHLIPADQAVPLSAIRQQAGAVRAMLYDPARALEAQKRVLQRFQDEVEKGAQ